MTTRFCSIAFLFMTLNIHHGITICHRNSQMTDNNSEDTKKCDISLLLINLTTNINVKDYLSVSIQVLAMNFIGFCDDTSQSGND